MTTLALPFQTEIITRHAAASSDHVLLVATVEGTGELVMVRHRDPHHGWWTYPQMRRPHPRVTLHATAMQLIGSIGYQHTRLDLLDLITCPGHDRPAAVFAATVRPSAAVHPSTQALYVVRADMTALDLRPQPVTNLLIRAGHDPADAIEQLRQRRGTPTGT